MLKILILSLSLLLSSFGFAKSTSAACNNSEGIKANLTLNSEGARLVVNWDGRKKSNELVTLQFMKDDPQQTKSGVSFTHYDNHQYLFELILPKRAVNGSARSTYKVQLTSRFDGLSPVRNQYLNCLPN